MRSLRGWILCAFATLGCASTAVAATPDSTQTPNAAAPSHYVSLYHKWEVSPSFTAVVLNTNIRVDPSNGGGEGTTIDAEKDLGLATVKPQPRIQGRMRIGRRSELEGGYQWASRTGEKDLERTITFRDTTFNVGASLDSKLTTNLLFLNYRYAFMAKERTQLGLGVGLGALFLKAELDALASAGGGGVSYSASEDFTAPVGSLGLYGRFLHGSRWYTEADARIVKLRIDRFHFRYIEGDVAERYYLSHKVGLELGVGADAVKVDVDPRFDDGNQQVGPSSQIKFSLTNFRLGLVYIP
jgi:hypothetical protein